MGQLRKSPRKSSRWDLFPETDFVTSIRWAQLRITFSLRKKNDSRKPEIFFLTFDCYHLNQARTRPGPRAGSGRCPGLCRSVVDWYLRRVRRPEKRLTVREKLEILQAKDPPTRRLCYEPQCYDMRNHILLAATVILRFDSVHFTLFLSISIHETSSVTTRTTMFQSSGSQHFLIHGPVKNQWGILRAATLSTSYCTAQIMVKKIITTTSKYEVWSKKFEDFMLYKRSVEGSWLKCWVIVGSDSLHAAIKGKTSEKTPTTF
jgi:hypothetical protein